MKRMYWIGLLLLLVPACTVQAQDTPGVVSLSTTMLSAERTLDLGTTLWRFQEGDNPNWADPALDDSNWTLMQPLGNGDEAWQGLGWFRIRLRVDSMWQQTILGLAMYHTGASEIYLNGQRVVQYGTIGRTAEEDVHYTPKGQPVSILLDQRDEHVLAVRFSNRALHLREQRAYQALIRYPWGFSLEVGPSQPMVDSYISGTRHQWYTGMVLGLTLLLTIIHFVLMLLERRDWANLYFGLAMLVISITFPVGATFGDSELIYSAYLDRYWFLLIAGYGWSSYFILLLASIYATFAPQWMRGIWVVVALAVVGLSLMYRFPVSVIFVITLVPSILESLRVTIYGVYKRKEDAWILLMGYIVTLLAILLYGWLTVAEDGMTGGVRFSFEGTPGFAPDWPIFFLPLTVPICMSIILARRFARRGRKLQAELDRVQALSEQTLAQEREKQALIATQNERLEAEVAERTAELEAAYHEVQVEAALERVRSRTMAMQASGELGEVVQVVFQEALRLGFGAVACDLVILNKTTGGSAFWISGEKDIAGQPLRFYVPRLDHPHYAATFDAWSQGESMRQTVLEGETCASYMRQLTEAAAAGALPADVQAFLQDISHIAHTEAFMRYGYLRAASLEPLRLEAAAILQRFGRVFEQTYTRFLDLEQAESQAREAQVEAALERVRARTMAMSKTDELRQVVAVLFEQLQRLEIDASACGIVIYDEATADQKVWLAGFSQDAYPQSYRIPYVEHPYYVAQMEAWRKGEAYHEFEFVGDLKRTYDEVLFTQSDYKDLPEVAKTALKDADRIVVSDAFMRYGMLEVAADTPLPVHEASLLQRFARVFEQTYTRFLDLAKAEAQTREAQVEVALERVRSRALAMQTSEELTDVATELRKQMALLGQRELEVCMVHLYEDAGEFFTSWGAIRPPGHDGDLMTFQGQMPTNVQIMQEVLALYASDTNDYVVVNEGTKATEWMQVLQTHIPFVYDLIRPIVEALDAPPLRAFWAFSDFFGGSLGMVTYQPPDEEALDLLRRCARVFGLAYRRFKDLQQTEADHQALVEEKALTEQALADLRLTQSQLVHAEKMASLGQLTAGIAHEIKNPLNFINNFAEVNEELAQELREALADGDDPEEIITDLEQNASVIAQHGKRADSIIRNMMAHARSGTGERVPTDLNALVNEHIDLAYHGKRATSPGYTVTIERHLDEAVGMVELVPQDIGRVVLNLLSNAFDVLEGQENACVTVATRRVGDHVEVRVTDNGPGMTDQVQAMVFEPFFTTKPAGQGTGLGLSLSYDIITQGHGGTMTVESTVGQRTVFAIMLGAGGGTR